MKVAKGLSELSHIAYEMIDWQKDLDQISFDTYRNYFPEITNEMNFFEIQNIVNKSPNVASLAREEYRNKMN